VQIARLLIPLSVCNVDPKRLSHNIEHVEGRIKRRLRLRLDRSIKTTSHSDFFIILDVNFATFSLLNTDREAHGTVNRKRLTQGC
jgi:hypothetical protein